MRKGLGYGLGKGYFNLLPKDSHIHALSAKGISLKQPNIMLLPPKQYDSKFKGDYSAWEVGYATTKIKPSGDVDIYVKHDGDYDRTGRLIAHELNELEIWNDLVKKGMNPDFAEELAHNKNPIKIEGVDNEYELDYSLNAKSINNDFTWDTIGVNMVLNLDMEHEFMEIIPDLLKGNTLNAKVNLKKYAGTWNQQSAIPAWFQKNCKNVQAMYKVRDDGKVDVYNSCSVKGKRKVVKGIARSVSKDNKKLKVNFGIPFAEGDYVIEYLSADYKYAVVGHPEKKYLWILSRDKNIGTEKYNQLVNIAEEKGYNISRLQR